MSNRPNRRPTTQTSTRVTEARNGGGSSRPWLLPAVIVAVVVAGILAVVIARSSSDTSTGGGTDPALTADPPSISGSSLPQLPQTGADPAVGMTMPQFKGTDINGKPLSLTNDGKPRAIIYLAHWCPHCQAEVSELLGPSLKANGLPTNVELQAVTTAIDPKRPNYPPGDWLRKEGWPVPTLVDTSGEVAEASGLSGFPFYVFVGPDGKVVKRMSGEMDAAKFQAELDALAAGSAATTNGTAGPSSPAK